MLALSLFLLSGCTSSRTSSVALQPSGEIAVSGADLPGLHLEFNGETIPGLLSAFSWTDAQAGTTIGGENLIPDPPDFPAALTAQVGQAVEIVLPESLEIPILTLTERDAAGRPIRTVVLKPEEHRHSYVLDSDRLALLDVTAQWPNLDYVTYRFQVDLHR
jgi:hypothetical protein